MEWKEQGAPMMKREAARTRAVKGCADHNGRRSKAKSGSRLERFSAPEVEIRQALMPILHNLVRLAGLAERGDDHRTLVVALPTPNTTATRRRKQLDAMPFVDVRSLAYMFYKKPDGSPLLSYLETIGENAKGRVKDAVIHHEIALGLVDDLPTVRLGARRREGNP
jgi:hypothetical protein